MSRSWIGALVIAGWLAAAADAPAQYGPPGPLPPADPASAMGMPPGGGASPQGACAPDLGIPVTSNAFQHPEPCQDTFFWVRAEDVLFWFKKAPEETPLVTTATNPNTSNNFGALGQSRTHVLFGGANLNRDLLEGGQLSFGSGPGCPVPAEINIFFAEEEFTNFDRNSNGFGVPLLARPLFATNLANHETVALSSFPGEFTGGIKVTSFAQMWGAEPLFTPHLCQGECLGLDLLVGFKYLVLREGLQIDSSSTTHNNAFPLHSDGLLFGAGNSILVVDDFKTKNDFRGSQLGLRASANLCDNLSVSLDTKIALGSTEQVVDIHGNSSLINSSGTTTVPGGILAVATNSGHFTRSKFGYIPEADLNIGYDVCPGIRFILGGSFIYWNDVVRPGDEVSRIVDLREVPSSASFNSAVRGNSPAFRFKTRDYWASGCTAGLEFDF